MDKFKEQVVFELEKDTPFNGAREFRYYIARKYGFKPSTELYREITNYQIDKYGTTSNYANWQPYEKNFKSYNTKKRIRQRNYNREVYNLEKLVKRNDLLHNREA